MLVANAFDLWQKDAFFAAAEKVQESADILESAYRLWLRRKEEGVAGEEMQGLSKELQAALSTAKWQLEEFERAVRMSYGNCRDENRIARHQQFVVAMESQISMVEAAFSMDEGRAPFQWVKLDETERDDLAMFLSGAPAIAKSAKEEYVKPVVSSQSEIMPAKGNWDRGTSLTHVSDDIRINVDGDCAVELTARKEARTTEDLDEGRVTNIRRTWTSPNFNSLRVIVPEADEEMTPLTPNVQDSSKEKSSRLFLRGQNQLYRWFYGLQNTVQKPRLLHVNRSVQLMFVFMLTLFLFVPFVIHSA